MRKISTLILTVIFSITSSLMLAQPNIGDRFSVDNITYEVISGSSPIEDFVKLVSPQSGKPKPTGEFTVLDFADAGGGFNYQIIEIDENAFSSCNELTKVNIGQHIATIGKNAFAQCEKLENIEVDENNQYFKSISGVLFNKDNSTLIKYPEGKTGATFTMPEGVTAIEEHGFKNTKLTEITIPKSLETFGKYVFASSKHLKNIYVSDENLHFADDAGVLYNKNLTTLLKYPSGRNTCEISPSTKTIEDASIIGMKQIKKVIIPQGVKRIEDNNFAFCDALEEVSIPNSVSYLGDYTFGSMSSMNKMICYVTHPNFISTKEYTFSELDTKCTLYVPAESINAYQNNGEWNTKFKEIKAIVPVEEIKLSITADKKTIGINEEIEFEITLLPENATIKNCEISTKNNTIAAVRVDEGKYYIRGKAVGTTEIDISADGGKKILTLPVEVLNVQIGEKFTDGNFFYKITHAMPLQVALAPQKDDHPYYDDDDKKPKGNLQPPGSVSYAGKEYAVTAIGEGAFIECSSIKSIEIPASVKTIGYTAFADCDSLYSIHIPEGVEHIEGGAFYSCEQLVKVSLPSTLKSIEEYLFTETPLISLYVAMENPQALNVAEDILADFHTEGTTLFVPNGNFAKYKGHPVWKKFPRIVEMKDIVAVESIRFEPSEKTIGNNETIILEPVFTPADASDRALIYTSNKPDVAEVWIDYSDKKPRISAQAEGECIISASTLDGSLQATLALTVRDQSVGEKFKEGGLYYQVTHLSPLEVSVCSQNSDSPYYDDGEAPKGAISIPANVSHNGKEYKVTGIRYSAFKHCSNLTSVNVLAAISIIHGSAFYGCSSLTSVSLPASVKEIGSYAFYDCTGLTSINIPNSVTKIEIYAFESCSGLTSITIPNSVTKIGEGAFYDCTGLTSVNIPNSVTKIGEGAFWNCTGLTSITIPNSVTNIEIYAFGSCSGLTSITIPNSVTNIEMYAFEKCSGLTSINIPNSVTNISLSAFENCTGLTSVTIPNSVTKIGEKAFEKCSGLKTIYSFIEDVSLVSLGDDVFKEIDKNSCILHIPAGTKYKYKAAPQWKDFQKMEEDIVLVESITLTPSEANVAEGASLQLQAVANPDNASNKEFTWTSSNEYMASVDENGKVSGLHAGELDITVHSKDGNASATCRLRVIIPVESITLTPSEANVAEGASLQLQAVAHPDNASNKEFIWTSSNEYMASVDENGKVSGLHAGELDITVHSKDGNASATCRLRVVIPVESISLSKTSKEIKVSETFTLVATVAPDNASNKAVNWSSDNEAVATVDENGKVTAIAEGTANITAKTADGGKTAVCVVTVSKSGTGIKNVNASNVLVYPNPSQGIFFVEVPQKGYLQIVSISGKLLQEKALKAGKNEVSIKQKGMYIIHITGKDYKSTRRIFIK